MPFEIAQPAILTRAECRTPKRLHEEFQRLHEEFRGLAIHQATLRLCLRVVLRPSVTVALIPAYSAGRPVAVMLKASLELG